MKTSGLDPAIRAAAQGMSFMRVIDRQMEAMASVWRTDLSKIALLPDSITSVSRSIAAAVAAQQTVLSQSMVGGLLPEIGRAVNLQLDQVSEFRAQIEQIAHAHSAFQRQLAQQVLGIHDALARSFAPLASIAAIDWSERFKSWTEEDRKLDAKLRRYGWWVAPNWTPDESRAALEIGLQRGKRALDAAICERYRKSAAHELVHVVDAWMDDPAFKRRRGIISDALADHRRHRYRVSVPTLLPLLEGVVFDVFSPSSTGTNPWRAFKDATAEDEPTFNSVLTDGMLTTLTAIWRPTSFVATSPYSRALNRHLILHGRTIRYGTEVNSLKVFLALDHLASESDAWRRQKARSVAADLVAAAAPGSGKAELSGA